MNILFIEQPLWNRGDESAHKGLLRALCKKVPHATVTVLFVNQKDEIIKPFNVNLPQVEYVNVTGPYRGIGKVKIQTVKRDACFLRFLYPTVRKVLPYYKRADIVLCAPGGINMGGFQSWSHLFFLKLAQCYNKPLVYYGRSIGPFPTETRDNRAFRDASYKLLRYCSFLCLRDRASEKCAKRMGIESISTVDSAFLDAPNATVPVEIGSAIGDSEYVVFVPNSLTWHYTYKHVPDGQVIHYFQELLKILFASFPGYKVVMLPQTYTNGENDEVRFFEKIADWNERVIIVNDTYSSDIQQAIIKQAELVIGARYHSIVFAINNGIPYVSLSYEHKMSGLLETLGTEDAILDLTHAFDDEESVLSSLAVFKEKLNMAQQVKNVTATAKLIASNCFARFVEFVNSYQKP